MTQSIQNAIEHNKTMKNIKQTHRIHSNHVEGALVAVGTMLALLEVEEAIMQKAIPSTSKRAEVCMIYIVYTVDITGIPITRCTSTLHCCRSMSDGNR